ncbi:hypothetical protein [Gellertiella hungarica]|uniref:Uncharacterized protein n=1 Tax=Gellertiella hungarica TaxID=1572859 RepID=A0A7W6NNH3_9HYPH|nr:hypothetical protein [Gellertiella hungarica]MBB4067417.1 hypothetical protein [Gellertiella hungarica]
MTYTHPALSWLIKHDPEAALAVFHRLRDEYYTFGIDPKPNGHDPREMNADDAETHDAPDTELTGETMSEAAQDGPDEIWPEMLHEMEPDIHEMLRSAGGIAWPWCGVRRKRRGKILWIGEPWCYEFPEKQALSGKHIVSLGGLTFYTLPGARSSFDGGMLISYVNDHGQRKRPTLKTDKPRGGKRPHRGNPAGYLALRGAVASPLAAIGLRRPLSGELALPPMYDPLAGTQEARAVLKELGVDGSVSFDCLPFPATKLLDGIAKNARFLGGMSGRCQTASRATTGKRDPAEPLSGVSAQVVEEVASRGTLASIGIKLGYQGGYADRAGKRALLEVGRALVADNSNKPKKLAA